MAEEQRDDQRDDQIAETLQELRERLGALPQQVAETIQAMQPPEPVEPQSQQQAMAGAENREAEVVHKRLAAWRGIDVQAWHRCEVRACEAEGAKEEAAWHRKHLPDKQGR
jgi:hypothetical protein